MWLLSETNQFFLKNAIWNTISCDFLGRNSFSKIWNSLVQKNDLVKILGRGKLTVKIDITANAFSVSAKEAIEKAGGKAITLEK